MTTAHRLYVGTIGQGLWRSTDSGETFGRACDGTFVECHVRALAVHPRDPRTLYLGSELGLFRSKDGAGHWTQVESPINGLQVWSILLLPQQPETIVVGTCPSRLFVSPDGGRSWTEPKIAVVQDCPRIMHTRVTSLAADPVEPATIWAGVEIGGLLRSRDGGRTWTALGRGLSSPDIHALALAPPGAGNGPAGQHKCILASTNNDLNLSIDDGESWQPLGLGKVMPSPYFRGLGQQCGRPENVFLGNGDFPPGSVGALARSTDGGHTWRAAPLPVRPNSTVWNFAFHPADAELIYASSVSGEVFRSHDAGGAWEKLPREFGEIRALAWTP